MARARDTPSLVSTARTVASPVDLQRSVIGLKRGDLTAVLSLLMQEVCGRWSCDCGYKNSEF